MILYINVMFGFFYMKILWYFSSIEGEYEHAASKCFHKYIIDGQFINKYIFALDKIYMKSRKLSYLKSLFRFQIPIYTFFNAIYQSFINNKQHLKRKLCNKLYTIYMTNMQDFFFSLNMIIYYTDYHLKVWGK